MNFIVIAIVVAAIAAAGKFRDLQSKLNEANAKANEANAKANEANAKLSDPNFNKQVAKDAFDRAEIWRTRKVGEIYFNVSDDELLNASRWISYAEPFAAQRSCLETQKDSWLSPDLLREITSMAEDMWDGRIYWSEECRRGYVTHHAFHTTGIEGNTLTLSETSLVINNQSLTAGFREDLFTPVTQQSIIEVQNILQIIDAVKLSNLPGSVSESFRFTLQGLVDINSAVTRGLGTPVGLRIHAVAIGHQLIVLPMPDEVEALMSQYMIWINTAINTIMDGDDNELGSVVTKALALACDAHTRLVHIHPFSDGNGRLARLVSGLVLQKFGLPMPMFLKEARQEYIGAVGAATIDRDYRKICRLHAEAVKRSLSLSTTLSKSNCQV